MVASALRQARAILRFPPVNGVDFGGLRRVKPISRKWGFDRGVPVDRHFIDRFLEAHRDDVRGRCLEIGGNAYTLKYGGDAVRSSDVLHYCEGNPDATIVGDLVDLPRVDGERFDCIICTQTLQFVSDPKAALATLHRILAPGGVLLLTVPCLSQLDRNPANSWQDNWRFTRRGVAELFRQAIGARAEPWIDAPGNVLVATAFLHGLSAGELAQSELDYRDPAYELLVTVRHRKPVFSL